ncbi:hypothetical protein JB92DRAFT_2838218 [Gautieria morchelliformis]|nr:hypothetical protein JB92DRAFT_2838218 [Gautieria morchelliformis]
MSSHSSRSYYYTSNDGSSSRPTTSRESLPPLRSVLGAQLDLPVKSGSGSYDLREMSKALPRQSMSSSDPDYRTSARSSSSLGAYGDRDRNGPSYYRERKSYTFPQSTNSAASNTHKGGHAHGYNSQVSSVNHGYQSRSMTPAYEDPGNAYGPLYSDPSRMDRGPGNKKYACKWPGCEKRFERQNALDTHMNIHTDQKPYPCPVANCGKAFNVRSNMRRHLLTHKDYHMDEDEYQLDRHSH